ncbi:MAG TPA: DUF1801 domain-containing protein [Caulifigura sp.]|nr:DUF1801 domain-containing protein [Caulifigura sp.]
MAKKATKKRAAARPAKAGGVKKPGAGSDWRAQALAALRGLILEADPEIVEERKWVKPTNPAGVPVWSHAGTVCTGETYKEVVKLTFFRGAALDDPHGLFNAGFNGGTRRAIDLHEGEKLNARAFKALVKSAVAENLKSATPKPKAASKPMKRKSPAKAAGKVKVLSGGNPQIAKGDGDAPVQAYIAAMPGWKREVGERLDELIERTVPKLQKAVKWNSPFYGVEGQGWFLGIHCFTKYVKLAFFRGVDLRPLPPGPSRDKNTRYLDIWEDKALDEAQLTSWLKQASAIPGWMP